MYVGVSTDTTRGGGHCVCVAATGRTQKRPLPLEVLEDKFLWFTRRLLYRKGIL